MRISEAIRMVEIAFGYSTAIHDDWKLDDEALTIAILAMKKQIPMKPELRPLPMSMCVEYTNANYCPNCGERLLSEDLHCPDCGQKLKWED